MKSSEVILFCVYTLQIVEALLAADLSGVNPYGIYDYCDGVGQTDTSLKRRVNRPLPMNLRDDVRYQTIFKVSHETGIYLALINAVP